MGWGMIDPHPCNCGEDAQGGGVFASALHGQTASDVADASRRGCKRKPCVQMLWKLVHRADSSIIVTQRRVGSNVRLLQFTS